jgi:hypothetical protein
MTRAKLTRSWGLGAAISLAALGASPACTSEGNPDGAAGSSTSGSSAGGVSSAAGSLGSGAAGSSPSSAGAGGTSGGGTSGASANGGMAGSAAGAATGGATTAGASTGGAATAGSTTGGSTTGGSTTGGSATGGSGSATDPVLHIFMLMGQSNMAGVAKREASDNNTDERFLVWGGCNQPAGKWNVAKPPLNDCPGEKGWNLSDTVDPGTWFGKTLLEKLPAGHTIGVVGTAESGESIDTFISGGVHHQMILNKIAAVKGAKNARFEGVIFHQGESDSGASARAAWPGKVKQLYNEVKAAFGVSYDVPFILGELPQGGCCGAHNTVVHQAAEQLPKGAWVSQEGTKVMDEYHFDHASVVLMGKRYGESMIKELGW